MDVHMRTIEAALQVKIAHRHEQFKVEGTKVNAKRGMEMLQALYEIAARPIDEAVVQLMLAGDTDMDESNAPALKTKFADLAQDIYPRAQQTPESLGNLHKAEIQKWWPIIKAAGIKQE